MRIDFEGRVAVVTGGANGIGLATARRLGESGACVALWDRVAAAGVAAADTLTREGLEVLFVETDVTAPDSVARAVEATVARFGGIDQSVIKVTRVCHGMLDGFLIDLVEHHSVHGHLGL